MRAIWIGRQHLSKVEMVGVALHVIRTCNNLFISNLNIFF